MASKSAVFVLLMVVVAVAAPITVAQLGIVGSLLGLIRIQGTVFCSINGAVAVINGTACPVFPNALVTLRCGSGNVVSSTTTNGSGVFTILLDPLQTLLSSLLSDCNLVVSTPLATCNAALPGLGVLRSPLLLIGNTIAGLLNVVNIVPTGFLLVPSA
ncbi:phylloplanin-like [Juglans regia]|uniref:Phylloplanin-like n=1 Tax=Juglans regia TaxID=51240 RepID=A0A2I4F1U4_JUGRE|nr:phylloplanin-like [Juglans regia]